MKNELSIKEHIVIEYGNPRTYSQWHISPETIKRNHETWDLSLIEKALGELRNEALLTESGERLIATEELCRVRERILHEKRLRMPQLINQSHYDAKMLIIALVKSIEIQDMRCTGMFFSDLPHMSFFEIETYLRLVDKQTITGSLEWLYSGKYINVSSGTMDNIGDASFELTDKGHIYYADEVKEILFLKDGAAILDLCRKDNLHAFWSWQSDNKDITEFIEKTLNSIVEELNKELHLHKKIKIDRAIESGEGARNIVINLQDKIRNADLFIADITPITNIINEKLIPNPNVMMELGYAIESVGLHKICLVAKASGKSGRYPFDIDQNHRITYSNDGELYTVLYNELKNMLKRNKYLH